MNGVRFGLVFILLTLPGLVLPLLRRLPPAGAARASATSLVAGGLLFEVFLIHAALPTVLHAAGLHAAALACERLGGHLLPASSLFGWPVAGLAVLLPAAGIRAAHRTRSQLRRLSVDPALGRHQQCDGYEVVTLPTRRPLALSLAGNHPQVLVSDGLEDMLSPSERRAVIRHEVAHLTEGHHRYVVLTSILTDSLGFLPPVAASLTVLRLSLERWADEKAAGRSREERAAVRRALLKLARWSSQGNPATAFSPADLVDARLRALDRSAVETGWMTWAPAVINAPMLVVAAVSLVAFLVHAWHLAFDGFAS